MSSITLRDGVASVSLADYAKYAFQSSNGMSKVLDFKETLGLPEAKNGLSEAKNGLLETMDTVITHELIVVSSDDDEGPRDEQPP